MGKKNTGLTARAKQVDPTLDALFSGSSGPVQAPPKTRYASLLERDSMEESKKGSKKGSKKESRKQPAETDAGDEDDDEGDDEELSEGSEELEYDESDDGESEDGKEDEGDASSTEEAVEPDEATLKTHKNGDTDGEPKRERKRKRKDKYEDLEDKYLSKLADEDDANDAEPAEKRQKSDAAQDEDNDGDDSIPQHESLAKTEGISDVEKANRTVYLGNVSTTAISSKSAKKELLKHLASVLDDKASPPEKVESIRFRSVAFSGGSIPKRAAYITGQLMDATTKSANAYVVYSTVAGAKKAVGKLNGSVILERHLRVDSVAHPAPTDHRRCVFVGNLGFVDDESVLNTDGDGETVKKKRNKTPADIEEGLWRTFSKQGTVESVRVPRDPKSRVGKGIAYVQFYDANDVESAVLFDGKKFPPMLPRTLRVTRAKDPRRTANALERRNEKQMAASNDSKNTKYKKKLTPEERSMAGRAGRLLGRSAASSQGRKTRGPDRGAGSGPGFKERALEGLKTPEQVVFEGARASSKGGRPRDLKLGGKSKFKSKPKAKPGKPTGRGARRAAEWKKKQ